MTGGETGTLAWVESPLQLLAAAELAARTGRRIDVALRLTSEHMTRTAEELLERGAAFASCVPYLGIPWRLLALERHWALGDGYSGQARAALAALQPRRLTLLDDGAQSVQLADSITGRTPFARPGVRESALARGLGARAGERMRRLASAERLAAFTMYADAEPVEHLAASGAEVVRNGFDFTRASARPAPLPSRRVVLGSALPVDGRMDERVHLAWVRRIAEAGPVAYLPHRREPQRQRAAVAALPGVELLDLGLPVELVLAGAPKPLEVHSLPSSALTSLAIVLAGTGSRLVTTPGERARADAG